MLPIEVNDNIFKYLYPNGESINPDLTKLNEYRKELVVNNDDLKLYECFEDFKECKICRELEKDLQLESCGHQICQTCYRSLIKHNKKLCPFCNQKILSTTKIVNIKDPSIYVDATTANSSLEPCYMQMVLQTPEIITTDSRVNDQTRSNSVYSIMSDEVPPELPPLVPPRIVPEVMSFVRSDVRKAVINYPAISHTNGTSSASVKSNVSHKKNVVQFGECSSSVYSDMSLYSRVNEDDDVFYNVKRSEVIRSPLTSPTTTPSHFMGNPNDEFRHRSASCNTKKSKEVVSVEDDDLYLCPSKNTVKDLNPNPSSAVYASMTPYSSIKYERIVDDVYYNPNDDIMQAMNSSSIYSEMSLPADSNHNENMFCEVQESKVIENASPFARRDILNVPNPITKEYEYPGNQNKELRNQVASNLPTQFTEGVSSGNDEVYWFPTENIATKPNSLPIKNFNGMPRETITPTSCMKPEMISEDMYYNPMEDIEGMPVSSAVHSEMSLSTSYHHNKVTCGVEESETINENDGFVKGTGNTNDELRNQSGSTLTSQFKEVASLGTDDVYWFPNEDAAITKLPNATTANDKAIIPCPSVESKISVNPEMIADDMYYNPNEDIEEMPDYSSVYSEMSLPTSSNHNKGIHHNVERPGKMNKNHEIVKMNLHNPQINTAKIEFKGPGNPSEECRNQSASDIKSQMVSLGNDDVYWFPCEDSTTKANPASIDPAKRIPCTSVESTICSNHEMIADDMYFNPTEDFYEVPVSSSIYPETLSLSSNHNDNKYYDVKKEIANEELEIHSASNPINEFKEVMGNDDVYSFPSEESTVKTNSIITNVTNMIPCAPVKSSICNNRDVIVDDMYYNPNDDLEDSSIYNNNDNEVSEDMFSLWDKRDVERALRVASGDEDLAKEILMEFVARR